MSNTHHSAAKNDLGHLPDFNDRQARGWQGYLKSIIGLPAISGKVGHSKLRFGPGETQLKKVYALLSSELEV
jgi:hypothetical protein